MAQGEKSPLPSSAANNETGVEREAQRAPLSGTGTAPSVAPRRRLALLEVLAVFLGILPAFFIGLLASSHVHWSQWFEKLGMGEAWGASHSRPAPAAKWLGHGEADFGDFCVRVYDPASGLLREASFQFRVVTTFDDRESFSRFIQSFGHLIRDEVFVTVRATSPSELQQVDYLARKVVTRVNRLLGQAVLKTARIENLSLSERAIAKSDTTSQTGP
ncbi:hypothetical protein [Thermogutta sp.]|uniref:hypothetical protein n=1 Tax=Thermogutta sp. TaxID=1962930 RepID=UPI00321FBB8D